MPKSRKRLPILDPLGHFYSDAIQAVFDKWHEEISPHDMMEVYAVLWWIANIDKAKVKAEFWRERGERFLRLYVKNQSFFAELLCAIEQRRASPIQRTVRGAAILCANAIDSDWHKIHRQRSMRPGLLPHIEIAKMVTEQLGRKVPVSASQIRGELKREKDRRCAINEKWRHWYAEAGSRS
jgi:hypothetical protein